MKAYKKIIILVLTLSCTHLFSQEATEDAGTQAILAVQLEQQLSTFDQIVQALKVAKESYDTYVKMEQEFNLVKQSVITTENRLHDISTMNSLNYNDVMKILNSTGCLMGNNYYYLNSKYANVTNMLSGGLVSCNNDKLYSSTFSGMKKKMVDGGSFSSPVSYSGDPNQDVFNVNESHQKFKTTQKKASDVNDASQNAYQANTLDASVKMKALAGSLDSLGTQLIKKSQDSDGNISEADRLNLYAKGLELHVQATETINKAYQMEREGTALSKNDAETFAAVKRKKLADECAVFRK